MPRFELENKAAYGLTPFIVSTALTLAIYFPQTILLLLKVGEVFGGVFDTSVPAYPLAGMLFVLIFLSFRRRQLSAILSNRTRSSNTGAAGLAIALIPLAALFWSGFHLSGSYSFAGIALVCSWVGFAVAIRPSLFSFLTPYLLLYLFSVGLVGLLTNALGDPLAIVIASISKAITWAFGLSVQWSTVYITFAAAGGQPISLVITQECSGIASMSIFLLVMGLVHLDMKPKAKVTATLTVLGALLFMFLNAARVVTLIVGGLYGGQDLLLNLHGWVGYLYYIVGYSIILLLFMRQHVPLDQKNHPNLNSEG